MPTTPLRRAGLPAAMALLATGALGTAGAGAAPAALPPTALAPADDSLDLAVTTDYMPTLGRLLVASGLAGTLRGPGSFTLFAPTEAAFARLPPGVLADLLKPENQARLQALLLKHVVPGLRPAAGLAGTPLVQTLEGGTLSVIAGPGGLTVNGARVRSADVGAQNGVIHFIDAVLVPPG